MADIWTIQRVLLWTSERFAKKQLDSPRLTAELLLAHVLGCDRVKLYLDFERPLSKEELAAFRGLIERRSAGVPTHYLIGKREFYGRPFVVDARVLIPRPETEQLVEAALARLAPEAKGPILELCTGSGCIGVTLAAERSFLEVIGVEVSSDAIAVSAENAALLGVVSRVTFLQGDLFAPVQGRTFPLIVSNPPYVQTGQIATLSAEVQQEPRLALDGGEDGLDVIGRIAGAAPSFLSPGGWLLLEIGDDQGARVVELFTAAGLVEARFEEDFAGHDRLALARRP